MNHGFYIFNLLFIFHFINIVDSKDIKNVLIEEQYSDNKIKITPIFE